MTKEIQDCINEIQYRFATEDLEEERRNGFSVKMSEIRTKKSGGKPRNIPDKGGNPSSEFGKMFLAHYTSLSTMTENIKLYHREWCFFKKHGIPSWEMGIDKSKDREPIKTDKTTYAREYYSKNKEKIKEKRMKKALSDKK